MMQTNRPFLFDLGRWLITPSLARAEYGQAKGRACGVAAVVVADPARQGLPAARPAILRRFLGRDPDVEQRQVAMPDAAIKRHACRQGPEVPGVDAGRFRDRTRAC